MFRFERSFKATSINVYKPCCNGSSAAECESVHFRSSESPAGNMWNLALFWKSTNSSTSHSTHVSSNSSTISLILSLLFLSSYLPPLTDIPDHPHRESHLNSLQPQCCQTSTIIKTFLFNNLSITTSITTSAMKSCAPSFSLSDCFGLCSLSQA